MFENLVDILMLLPDNPLRLIQVLPRSLIRDIIGSFPYMQTKKFKYNTGWWSLQVLASMVLQPLLAYPKGFQMVSLAYYQDLKGPGFQLFQNSVSYPTAVMWSQLIEVIDWMQNVESMSVLSAMHLGVSRSCFNSQCPKSFEVACRKVCGTCHGGIYCSRECQKAHWPTHKHFCPGKTFHRTRDGVKLLASQREMHVRQVFTSLLTTNINEFAKKLPADSGTEPLVVQASFQHSRLSFTIQEWSSSRLSSIFLSEEDARDDAEVIKCEGKVGSGPVVVHLDLRFSTMEQLWRSHGMMYISLDEFSLAQSD
ncbi:hypothetical protein DL96DRAFT_233977 [Flagelloscypha sp. PMI_526]|nr:hypothetical protein DL96DRAFT_233977 [Flagelloscypha sp. PMI_526]